MSPFVGFRTVGLPSIVRARTCTAVQNHAVAAWRISHTCYLFVFVMLISKAHGINQGWKYTGGGWLAIYPEIPSNHCKNRWTRGKKLLKSENHPCHIFIIIQHLQLSKKQNLGPKISKTHWWKWSTKSPYPYLL